MQVPRPQRQATDWHYDGDLTMRKIIKPGQLGLLFKPYRYRQQDRLAVSALMFFEIGGDGSLLVEQESWPRILPQLGAMQVLDECMPKQGAEVLVAGSAYSPDGEPVTEMEVRLQCGSINKTLQVIGERSWRYGLMPLQQIDKPQPFTQMPLDLSRAWGGEQNVLNPVGRGYTDSRLPALFKRNEGEMPNVQFPGEKLKPGRAKHQPAGFGPLPIGVKQRQQYTGTYNQKWLKEDFPGLARDIDWRFFNMAPQDQWLSEPFQGGERFLIEGMHPQLAKLEGQLPTSKPRAFVGNTQEPCREVELKADTLWLLPSEKLAVLVWHGETEVTQSDAQDLKQLMLAVDDPAAPRSLGYFADVMALRTDKETAADHAFNEAQLLPPVPEKALDHSADEAEQAVHDARMQALEADFRERYQLPETPAAPEGDTQASVAEAPMVLPVPTQAQIANGQIDLTATRKGAEQLLKDSEKRAEQQLAELKKQTGTLPAPEPVTAEQALQKADPQIRLQQTQAKFAYMPLSSAQREQLMQQTAEIEAQQQLARRYQREPGEQPLSDEAISCLQTLVRQRLQKGESLQGFDLTGIQLQGIDFSRSDLRGVCFERATLHECDFTAAQMDEACLLAAQITSCSFNQTSLNKSNWAKAGVSSCEMKQVQLAESQWSETRLTDTDLTGAVLKGALISQPVLRSVKLNNSCLDNSSWVQLDAVNCSWCGSCAEKLSWTGCQLEDCDLSGVDWKSSALLHCVGKRIQLTQVRMFKVLFTGAEGESQWPGSDWQQARLEECGLRATDLTGSNWNDAQLLKCDLGVTQLQQAQLQGALISQCMLMDAQLQQSDLNGVDLYGSVLRQVNLSEANLQDAQIYGADLSEACLIDAKEGGLWPEIVSPGVRREAA